MADTGNRAPPAPTDSQSAEQKMRRALGLHGTGNGKGQQHTPQQRPDQARQRHRFVQDGGVPVVVLNHRAEDGSVLKERIAELERQLENERGQHANSRRALQEAQALAQALETRLVHAELAHKDALTQERRALATAQQALNEALAEAAQSSARRKTAAAAIENAPNPSLTEAAVAAPAKAPALAKAAPAAASLPVSDGADPELVQPMAAAAANVPKKRGRPRTRPEPEPKPVRWWTPSFRTKTKA